MLIVVDASLATKWMVWEADSMDALAFLRRHSASLCGPDILFTEVAGAIVRQANMNKGLAADALDALRKWTAAWRRHAVEPHRVTQRRLYESGRMAQAIGHPIQDCIYLAIAMELNCELATCDAKFAAKANTVHAGVRSLADYAVV